MRAPRGVHATYGMVGRHGRDVARAFGASPRLGPFQMVSIGGGGSRGHGVAS